MLPKVASQQQEKTELTHGHSWADEEIVIWVDGRDRNLWERQATSAIGTWTKCMDLVWRQRSILSCLNASPIGLYDLPGRGYEDQAGGEQSYQLHSCVVQQPQLSIQHAHASMGLHIHHYFVIAVSGTAEDQLLA